MKPKTINIRFRGFARMDSNVMRAWKTRCNTTNIKKHPQGQSLFLLMNSMCLFGAGHVI
jgi:hypothetical protein